MMAFPEGWGPPPQFAIWRVTAEGAPLNTHTKSLNGTVGSGKEDKETACSRTEAVEEHFNGGPADEHTGDEAAVLFAVKGGPTADNEMLVKKGEYEGGFSIWECTWDLLGFLQKSNKREVNEVLSLVTCGHVLDLGCGHGLLGIWALKTGAPAVVFQDLNENVLKQATRWNILKNTENSILGSAAPHQHQLSAFFDDASPLAKAARFGDLGAGSIDDVGNSMQSEGNGQRKDVGSFPLLQGRALCLAASWEKYPKIYCSCQGAKPKATAEIKTTEGTSEGQNETVQEKDGSLATGIAETDMTAETLRQPNAREIGFSVIFCSEGIYREETFEPLAAIFKRLLHKDGIALVASKRYYFGIGGGSLAFMSFLREKYSDALSVEVADSFRSANSNNFRDVLLIRKKDKPDAKV